MPRKFDSKTLDHQIIRRALHNAAGSFEINFTEFSATWRDPVTNKLVDFTGEIDSQIRLKTARIRHQEAIQDLKSVFTDTELRAFNYLVNSEYAGRGRMNRAA